MIANCLVSCSQYCRWKLYEEKARKLYMTCWVISSCRSNLGPNFHEKNWYQVVNHVVWTHLKAVQIQRAWAWITVRLCTSIWRRKWEFHQIFKRDILIIKDNHARLQNHNQITIRTDPDVEPKFMWSSWGMLDRRASQHGSTLWYTDTIAGPSTETIGSSKCQTDGPRKSYRNHTAFSSRDTACSELMALSPASLSR